MRSHYNNLGLSEAKVEKIRETARKLDSRGSQFKTGIQVKGKSLSSLQSAHMTPLITL